MYKLGQINFPSLCLSISASVLMTGCGTSAIAPSNSAHLELDNQSGEAIYYLFYSECEADNWGEDRLGSEQVIAEGELHRERFNPGCWDFKSELQSGEVVEEYGVELLAGESFSWDIEEQVRPEGESVLNVYNYSEEAIFYLYYSDCESSGWGQDRLGADVVAAGESYRFVLWPGCWDMRAESASGEQIEQYGIELKNGQVDTWDIYFRPPK